MRKTNLTLALMWIYIHLLIFPASVFQNNNVAMILNFLFVEKIHFAEAYNFSYTAKRKSLIVYFIRIYYYMYFDAFIFHIFIS